MLLVFALAGPAEAGRVTLDLGDGVVLAGEEWGGGQRAVLLLHDEGGDRSDWGGLGAKLATAGFRELALDLRGHGATATARPSTDAEWLALVEDLGSATAWLANKGATDIHVVGAGA